MGVPLIVRVKPEPFDLLSSRAVTPWSPGTGVDEVTAVPFYTATTIPNIDRAHLMLMPQTSPVWTPSAGNYNLDRGAFVAVMYRMTTATGGNEVGYTTARDHPDFASAAGGYEGPLYVLAVFPPPADAAGDFTWSPGKGYLYNIGLGTPGSSNGYLGSETYFDETGNPTALSATGGGRRIGDPINDGVIHITLGVGGWDDTDGGSLPFLDPNPHFVAPEAPYIIYWDAATQTMQLGSWNAVTGGAVKTENQLSFNFGSTVGFLNQNDPWDASDIKFNVTSTTDYTSLPDWGAYTGTKSTTDGYISTADYHNAANVPAGYGDPCKLVGLTVDQVKRGIIDNGRFRMSMTVDNVTAGWTAYGTRPASATLNTTWGVMSSTGTFLPGSSSRTASGAPYQVGRSVFFWNSQANDDASALILDVNPNVNPSGIIDSRNGIPVRCIDLTTPYPLSATLNSSQYFENPSNNESIILHGNGYITDQGLGISYYDSNGNDNPLFGGYFWVSDSNPGDNTRAPYFYWTGTNPAVLADNAIKTNAYNVRCVQDLPPTPNPVGEVAIPSADGTYTTVWAGSNLSAKGVFATSETDYGVFFQWGRNVAYTFPGNNNSVPDFPALGTDQTDAAVWPAATDPCPWGWRVPTLEEWNRFVAVTTDPGTYGNRTFTSPYGSITLPASGFIQNGNGVGVWQGQVGSYWQSDQYTGGSADYNSERAYTPYWWDNAVLATSPDDIKDYASPVRCVRTQ